MKQAILFAASVCLFLTVNAQADVRGKALFHYVFPTFKQAAVRQKSGEINKALLNYNSLTEEMIYEQEGQMMALDRIELIDTVFFDDKKFIPEGKVFYELAVDGPIPLFIQHKTDVFPPGSETGFGKTNTSAAANVTDLKALGRAYQLQLPDEYILSSKKVFWLKKGNNYYVLKDLKDVQNLFVEKKEAIKEFAKTNKINFKKEEDLTKLVVFSNGNN